MSIIPLHEIRDLKKFEKLSKSMNKNGWIGREILAIDMGEYTQAITGSHRIAAALENEIEIPVYTIEVGEYNPLCGEYADETADLISAMLCGDDDDRVNYIERLVEIGKADKKALSLAIDEVRNN